MKKSIIFALLAISSSFTLANGYIANSQTAAYGYTGPAYGAAHIKTVTETKSMPDDSYVTLRGKIINHIQEDKFLFQDHTGSITLEVDDELWYGITVSPTDNIEIVAEVDKEGVWPFNEIEIEAKQIRKI